MSDPDMGNWSYVYDALGNLTSQTDARTCVTTLGYDALNRLTDKLIPIVLLLHSLLLYIIITMSATMV
jgi:YD repeat-containing protein